MPWLFSYGSNGPAQLAQRLGREVQAYAAYTTGWRRVYRGRSAAWGGGVATLVPRDWTTYGNAILATDRDLVQLDRYEGAGYARSPLGIVVRLPEGDVSTLAVAYFSTSPKKTRPSARYLQAVADSVGTFWSSSSGKKLAPSDFDNRA